MNNYWNNVRSELSFQGKSQIELANYIGLSVGTLRNKMNLQALPTFETAIKISEFLNVSIEYLYSGIRQKNELSQDDKSLLNEYHQLSDHDKKVLRTILSTMNKVAAEITPDDTNYVFVEK